LAANVFRSLRDFWAEFDGLEFKNPWSIPMQVKFQNQPIGGVNPAEIQYEML
jgi:hypothetical protein